MKNGYVKKMIVGGLFAVALAGLAACGSDSGTAVAPVGKVVKGPVSGADVFSGSSASAFTQTEADGTFKMTQPGPYRTSGGKYLLVAADGTTSLQDAPPLSAPAGYAQITPISTIIHDVPAAEADLKAILLKMGVSDIKTADFASKKSDNSNGDALAFAESLGAILTTTNKNISTKGDTLKSDVSGAVSSGILSVVTSLATTVKNGGTLPDTTTIATTLANTVNAEVSAVITAKGYTAELATLTSEIAINTVDAAKGMDTIKPGTGLPAPTTSTTGSTGGTGGTSGLQ